MKVTVLLQDMHGARHEVVIEHSANVIQEAKRQFTIEKNLSPVEAVKLLAIDAWANK